MIPGPVRLPDAGARHAAKRHARIRDSVAADGVSRCQSEVRAFSRIFASSASTPRHAPTTSGSSGGDTPNAAKAATSRCSTALPAARAGSRFRFLAAQTVACVDSPSTRSIIRGNGFLDEFASRSRTAGVPILYQACRPPSADPTDAVAPRTESSGSSAFALPVLRSRRCGIHGGRVRGRRLRPTYTPHPNVAEAQRPPRTWKGERYQLGLS